MNPEGPVRLLGPYGWGYYESLVMVQCGDKTGMPDVVAYSSVVSLDLNSCPYSESSKVLCELAGFFMGGHYDRGDPSPDSDIWIECFCSDCKQSPSPGLPGRRMLCRHFEGHGGECV